MIVILASLGPKHAFKVAIQYPAIILMPIFTTWTFGPPSLKKYCTSSSETKLLKMSFPLTWLNLILTTLLYTFINFQSSTFAQFPLQIAVPFGTLPFIIVIWVTFIVVQLLEKYPPSTICQSCCCFSQPFFEMTSLDVESSL